MDRGRSRKTSSRPAGSIAAITAASSAPTRCLSFSGRRKPWARSPAGRARIRSGALAGRVRRARFKLPTSVRYSMSGIADGRRLRYLGYLARLDVLSQRTRKWFERAPEEPTPPQAPNRARDSPGAGTSSSRRRRARAAPRGVPAWHRPAERHAGDSLRAVGCLSSQGARERHREVTLQGPLADPSMEAHGGRSLRRHARHAGATADAPMGRRHAHPHHDPGVALHVLLTTRARETLRGFEP